MSIRTATYQHIHGLLSDPGAASGGGAGRREDLTVPELFLVLDGLDCLEIRHVLK